MAGVVIEAAGAVMHGFGAAAGATSSAKTLFRFEAGIYRGGEFSVEQFDGREELSRLYRFEVTVAARGVDASSLEPALLAQSAALDFSIGTTVTRHVHGVVTALSYLGTTADVSTPRVRLRVEPRAALLKRNRRSRIFQDLTTQEIVTQVLAEAGVHHEFRLRAKYARRTYCVQYRESDWTFIKRLLGEDGVYFYFEQPAGLLSDLAGVAGEVARAVSDVADGALGDAAGAAAEALDPSETMILIDAPDLYPPMASATPDDPAGMLDAAESVVGGAASAASTAMGTVFDLSSVAIAALAAVQTVVPSAALLLRPADRALNEEDNVTRLELRRTVRPQASLVRAYDFQRPDLELRATASTLPASTAIATASDPAALASAARTVVSSAMSGTLPQIAEPLAIDPGRYEVYEHHSKDETPDITRRAAQAYLEGYRTPAFVGHGESYCRRLAPGYRFQLLDHPVDTLNREYVTTAVRHYGRTSSAMGGGNGAGHIEEVSYRNEFECAPGDHPVRPARPRRRLHQVHETAIVVGPGGEEIYTDAFGRVKVQFHWDLLGRRDEHSSCWLRVAQSWAGAGFGHQMIPRVGMEVLVGFLGGDQDRPHVVGCLYNGSSTPPFTLPDDRSRSGWRTSSTPGGEGFSEFSIEDRKGGEEMYLRAERNLVELVRNDHAVTVLHDEKIDVQNDQTTSVTGDRTETVAGSHAESIDQDRSVTVKGNQSHVSECTDARWVKGDLNWRVDGRTRLQHTLGVDETYLEDQTLRISGCQTTVIGTADARRHQAVHIEGTALHHTTKGTEFSSDTEVLIRCGKSSILIGPESIELSSPSLVLHSDFTQMTMDSKTVNIRATQDLIVRGDKTATLLGQTIAITSPAAIQDKTPDVKVTTLALADSSGKPLANQRYRLVMSDGSMRSGFLDADGKAEVAVTESGEVQFPDMKLAE